MPGRIDLPADLGDLFGDPQRIRDAIDLLNALAQLEVHLVPAGNTTPIGPGVPALKGDAPRPLILPLPLKFKSTIANSTATAASVSTQLNLLLAALRDNGQLPT